MKLYQLYVKAGGDWAWEREIEAVDKLEALREALDLMAPSPGNCVIRIETEDGRGADKHFRLIKGWRGRI